MPIYTRSGRAIRRFVDSDSESDNDSASSDDETFVGSLETMKSGKNLCVGGTDSAKSCGIANCSWDDNTAPNSIFKTTPNDHAFSSILETQIKEMTDKFCTDIGDQMRKSHYSGKLNMWSLFKDMYFTTNNQIVIEAIYRTKQRMTGLGHTISIAPSRTSPTMIDWSIHVSVITKTTRTMDKALRFAFFVVLLVGVGNTINRIMTTSGTNPNSNN